MVLNLSAKCKVLYFLLVFVASGLFFLGCSEKNGSPRNGKLRVVATTTIVGNTVAEIGGDKIELQTLMGPGVDPHLYKASEGDVRRIGNAQIIFYNGLHLEAKLGGVLERLGGQRTVVAVTEKIPVEDLLVDEDYGAHPDPHVWFDVKLWRYTVDVIRDALIKEDPDNQEYYTLRAKEYAEELLQLDEWVHQQLNRVEKEKRILITAHDAFRYLEKSYGIEVRGLQGMSTVAEASAQSVNNLAEFISTRKIPVIFIESSIPKRNILAVQEGVRSKGFEVKIGGELYSDALGSLGSPAGTYTGMVKHNIETIVTSLLGESDKE